VTGGEKKRLNSITEGRASGMVLSLGQAGSKKSGERKLKNLSGVNQEGRTEIRRF